MPVEMPDDPPAKVLDAIRAAFFVPLAGNKTREMAVYRAIRLALATPSEPQDPPV